MVRSAMRPTREARLAAGRSDSVHTGSRRAHPSQIAAGDPNSVQKYVL